MSALATLFAIGFAAGLALAIPVGPMAIMLINTTIEKGWRHGSIGALAMATVDGLYATTVFFVGGVLASWLKVWSLYLSLGGALILLILGISTLVKNLKLLKKDSELDSQARFGSTKKKTFAIFFAATVINPPTALYFLAIAPSVSSFQTNGLLASGLAFAVGVFVGSIIWQESLALAGIGLRTLAKGSVRLWTGILGGLLIIALAVSLAVKAFA